MKEAKEKEPCKGMTLIVTKKRLLLHRHTVHRRHVGRSLVVIGTI